MSTRRPLRIAFIGARGVANTYSGIETYYEEVGSRLAARGHQVVAYCRSHFTPPLTNFRGITVRRLPSLRRKHFDTFVHTLLSTIDALPRRFDLIQYHALGPSLFAFLPRLFGHTTVASVRGLDWQRAKWARPARGFLRLCEVASIRFPSATVVVSQTLQEYYQQCYQRSPIVIPNGVQKPLRRLPNRIKSYGLERRSFLLFAGRLSPEKGCHLLLEAFRPLDSSVTLAFAGGSSFSDKYIANLRARAWDRVVFLGNVDREMMEELYSNCYAFVLPSYMEGLSISLLEALSYGACAIVSDLPENVEVVGDAGLRFRSGDIESLRGALQAVLETPDLAEECRQRAKAIAAQRWDWDEVTRRTEQHYYELLDRQASRVTKRAVVERSADVRSRLWGNGR